MNKTKSKNSQVPNIEADVIDEASNKKSSETELIDSEAKNSIESDRDYRGITKDIITHTTNQLKEHKKAKAPLRKTLMWFVIILLTAQFLVLSFILIFNTKWRLNISDFVINVYIVSLFVETLAGLIIMIRFSFDSKQEVELISILNSIVVNFKKYNDRP